MIYVYVTYHCKKGMGKAFVNALEESGLAAACRNDAGNIQYRYYYGADDPDEVVLLEKWEDSESLALHAAQPHMKDIGACKEKYVDTVEIVKLQKA